MNFFRKLFRRKKNTIHLSPEEAYASEEEAPKPAEEPAPEQVEEAAPLAATPEPETGEKNLEASARTADESAGAGEKETGNASETAASAPEEAQPGPRVHSCAAVFARLEDPACVREKLRPLFREMASGFAEDENMFTFRFRDKADAKLEITCFTPGMPTEVETLPPDRKRMLSGVLRVLENLNLRLDIVVDAVEGFDIMPFIRRTAKELEGYYAENEAALYRWDGALLISKSGESELAEPEAEKPAETNGREAGKDAPRT